MPALRAQTGRVVPRRRPGAPGVPRAGRRLGDRGRVHMSMHAQFVRAAGADVGDELIVGPTRVRFGARPFHQDAPTLDALLARDCAHRPPAPYCGPARLVSGEGRAAVSAAASRAATASRAESRASRAESSARTAAAALLTASPCRWIRRRTSRTASSTGLRPALRAVGRTGEALMWVLTKRSATERA
jgi:hypothetical protein